MKRSLNVHWTVGGAVAAFCLAVAQASVAEVRSATLGIDINCPSGLSE